MGKKAIYLSDKYLASFWILILAGFLGLQFSAALQADKKTEQETKTMASFLIATAQHSVTTEVSPDLKFLQNWFQHDAETFEFINKIQNRPGFVFHILFKIELIRLLQASISINAP